MTEDDLASLRARLTMMARRLRKEARHDAVSWSRMLIVGLIDRMGGTVTPTMLAQAEGLSSANVAALLRDLERSKLIIRAPDQEDRRKIWISLSADGRRILNDSRASREQWLREAMQQLLTVEEQQQLFAASKLIERLASFGGDSSLSGKATK